MIELLPQYNNWQSGMRIGVTELKAITTERGVDHAEMQGASR